MPQPQYIEKWPRLMRVSILAEYCGVSTNTAKKDVASGRLPQPVIHEAGRVQWDKISVDRHLDRLADGNVMKGWDDVGG